MMETIAFVMKISRCAEITVYVIPSFMFMLSGFSLSFYFEGIDLSNLQMTHTNSSVLAFFYAWLW